MPKRIFLATLFLSTAGAVPPLDAGFPAGARKVGSTAGGGVLPSGRLLRDWGERIEIPGQPLSIGLSPKHGFSHFLKASILASRGDIFLVVIF
jgi:hypothetical protein